MRTLLSTLALLALLSSFGLPAQAQLPADEALLVEIAAVDRGFTPVEPVGDLLPRDFETLANPACSTVDDCPCPNLCQCISVAQSDKFCLCQLTCCTTPDCA